MTDHSTSATQEILPKHGNGTTERMAPPLKIEKSVAGIFEASLILAEQTANDEIDLQKSKVIQGHMTNGLGAVRTEISGLRAYDRAKNPRVQAAIAHRLGQEIRQGLLALEAPKESEAAPPASPGEAS